MDKKPKEPLAAVLLSFVLPGLGQVYAGKSIKGIIFFLVIVSLELGLGLYFLHPSTRINVFWFLAVLSCLGILLFVIIDAYLAAKKYNSGHNLSENITPARKILLIAAIVCVLGIYFPALFFIQAKFYRLYPAPPESMEPTIYKGELVLVDLRAYKSAAPKRGDVVLYNYPQESSG